MKATVKLTKETDVHGDVWYYVQPSCGSYKCFTTEAKAVECYNKALANIANGFPKSELVMSSVRSIDEIVQQANDAGDIENEWKEARVRPTRMKDLLPDEEEPTTYSQYDKQVRG